MKRIAKRKKDRGEAKSFHSRDSHEDHLGSLGGARAAAGADTQAVSGLFSPALRSALPRRCLPPISHELRALLEVAACPRPLTALPVPVSDGAPVLLVPGLFRGDNSLEFLAEFLRSAGCDSWTGGLGRNLGCSEATVERLTRRLETIVALRRQRVAIVGHRRGGLLARVVARRRPDLVSGVVMLGSPFRDPLAVHPILWAALLTVATLGRFGVTGVFEYSCAVGRCCEPFRRDLPAALPPDVGVLAVYSRRDGLVDWRSCVDAYGDQLEVATSHCEMPVEETVLRAIVSAVAGFADKNGRVHTAISSPRSVRRPERFAGEDQQPQSSRAPVYQRVAQATPMR
jgi:triacylglycerol lipase